MNRALQPEQFRGLRERLLAYLQGREVFVQHCYAGADPRYRLPIRVIAETAWHSLFARNMFIQAATDDPTRHVPEFTVIQAPHLHADRRRSQGTQETTARDAPSAPDGDALRQHIARRADGWYCERGRMDGFDVENWLAAEQEVLQAHRRPDSRRSRAVQLARRSSGRAAAASNR